VCILLSRKYSPIAQPEYGALSNKIKLPKVGSNVIVHRDRAQAKK
jgi:hypothetical protein